MKYIRIIIKGISILLLVISTIYSTLQYNKINEIQQSYEQYMNEETEIEITLNGLDNSLSHIVEYPEYDAYKSTYNEVKKLYTNLSNEEIIKEMKISNYMHVMIKWMDHIERRKEIKVNGIFETETLDITNGRTFTKEEHDEAKNVIILSSWFENDVNIGDKVIIECSEYYHENMTIQEFEVIGFYNLNNENKYYMPFSTLEKISNEWMNDAKDKNKDYYVFYPVGMNNPKIYASSEYEFNQIQNLIEQYNIGSTFKFIVTRNKEHLQDLRKFNTSENNERFIISMCVSIFLFIVLITIEFRQILLRKKDQRQFEINLMKEQEKNVQNIISMNQETYKLKHDLKHFFQQLIVYAKNNEIDKVIELLQEYNQDILELEIPVYTQNRTIDMLINHYLHKANELNINFTYSSTFINDLNIKERKLYILLSNALENAFLHCDNRKIVRMEIAYIEPYVRFVIMNTIDIHKESQLNHDKNHGHGLISMNQIIHEINGEINKEIQEDMYVCTIFVPIKN